MTDTTARAAGLAAIALVAGLALAPGARAQGTSVEAGLLTCESLPETRLNLVVHSEVDVRCVYEATDGRKEYYQGTTGIALGLDINWERKETMRYTVMTAGEGVDMMGHALAGNYGGGKASVTAGGGVGAAALIGGSEDHIALQPLALETSSGLGIAAGATWLHLEPAGAPQ